MHKAQNYFRIVCSMLLCVVCVAFAVGFIDASSNSLQLDVYAGSLEDDLSGGGSQGGSGSGVSQDDQDIAEWIGNHRGMTGEQLQTASDVLSPLTNVIGYVVGGIVVLIITLISVVTALDLLYISFPPVRNLLYKAGTDGTGAYTGGMPAGGYGMHRGYGMNMAGVGGAAGGTNKPTQWISDEAVACVAMMGGSQQAQTAGMGGMMGAAPQQQPGVTLKSVIFAYFKKRLFFIILLIICVMVLLSSVVLGTGVNLAQWIIKLIGILNTYIPIG